MDDVKEALFISLFFSVAVVGEFFDTLIQNMSLTIPNNLITFSIVLLFCIIWFKKEISKYNFDIILRKDFLGCSVWQKRETKR